MLLSCIRTGTSSQPTGIKLILRDVSALRRNIEELNRVALERLVFARFKSAIISWWNPLYMPVVFRRCDKLYFWFTTFHSTFSKTGTYSISIWSFLHYLTTAVSDVFTLNWSIIVWDFYIDFFCYYTRSVITFPCCPVFLGKYSSFCSSVKFNALT